LQADQAGIRARCSGAIEVSGPIHCQTGKRQRAIGASAEAVDHCVGLGVCGESCEREQQGQGQQGHHRAGNVPCRFHESFSSTPSGQTKPHKCNGIPGLTNENLRQKLLKSGMVVAAHTAAHLRDVE
jgi:hypothetical protein